MAFSSFLKTCVKNTPGNRDEVYLCTKADITSITLTSEEVSAITMESGKKFKRFQGELDKVQFQTSAQASTVFSEEQTLTMSFSKKTKAFNVAIYGADGVIDQVVCGLIVIRVDGNGRGWISGISPATVEGKQRPYKRAEVNFDSGMSPTEEDGAQPQLILKRTGQSPEYPLDDTLNAALVGGTATYIDWSA